MNYEIYFIVNIMIIYIKILNTVRNYLLIILQMLFRTYNNVHIVGSRDIKRTTNFLKWRYQEQIIFPNIIKFLYNPRITQRRGAS